jgi:hypothetical protein
MMIGALAGNENITDRSVLRDVDSDTSTFHSLLLYKNKLQTHDNVAKRREVEVMDYLFCCEHESILH